MQEFNHNKITELRTKEGLTIAEFAEKIGTTKQAVSAWETGASVPRVGLLLRICNVFGVALPFFISPVIQSERQEVA